MDFSKLRTKFFAATVALFAVAGIITIVMATRSLDRLSTIISETGTGLRTAEKAQHAAQIAILKADQAAEQSEIKINNARELNAKQKEIGEREAALRGFYRGALRIIASQLESILSPMAPDDRDFFVLNDEVYLTVMKGAKSVKFFPATDPENLKEVAENEGLSPVRTDQLASAIQENADAEAPYMAFDSADNAIRIIANIGPTEDRFGVLEVTLEDQLTPMKKEAGNLALDFMMRLGAQTKEQEKNFETRLAEMEAKRAEAEAVHAEREARVESEEKSARNWLIGAVVLSSLFGAYYSGRADFFFQVVFVATAMSIVSGAVAERMKLWPFLAFCVILTGFIYPLQGYWKWGGGFLDALGFSDFAGSGVVHLTGATAALAGVILVGARKGKYSKDGKINALPGANLPLATLGTFILWLGWFGFNGGSELIISNAGEANAVAAIFVNTNAAAAGGVIAALITARVVLGRADLTMVLNGALAGLVAITAEPLTPSPLLATLIGAVGGIIVVFSVLGLDRLRIDDPVGAISVHGTVGIWGLLAVPLTNSDINLNAQLIGIGVIFAFVFLASLLTWGVIRILAGLRVSEDDEYRGVDVSECGLEAYPEFTGNR